MKLELRDVRIKCKKLRRENNTTGTLRKDGKIIPVQLKGSDIDKYIKKYGAYNNINIEFEDSQITVKINNVEKDLINHNIINIDFEAI
ncbi:MAG: hypothetical protein ACRC57_09980 [Sarcina sp.]